MFNHKDFQYAFSYEHHFFSRSVAIYADCFEWMRKMPEGSVHAVVTDPPYGVKEFDP